MRPALARGRAGVVTTLAAEKQPNGVRQPKAAAVQNPSVWALGTKFKNHMKKVSFHRGVGGAEFGIICQSMGRSSPNLRGKGLVLPLSQRQRGMIF